MKQGIFNIMTTKIWLLEYKTIKCTIIKKCDSQQKYIELKLC